MTERKAWHCTGCGKTHAPHVDTCPEPVAANGLPLPGSPYVSPRKTFWADPVPCGTAPRNPGELFTRLAGGVVKDDPDHKMRYYP
ncbi:MAG: hypothetical protein Unbinned2301contig1004_12 [Prokaryotic dsDNA virus sp.]|nr:MAG: hypothetical protein Unbinned2301contig1004_12 [Prokaryotic dsDNA virus sp.]|tara:strand:- start:5527 stop:5781 length:255 start_codon:yes stop_codon:yes gene_type:complete